MPLRVERMSENALAIAEFCQNHPSVDAVYYPGLSHDPGHEIAQRQMQGGFGGLLSIRIKGGREAARLLMSQADRPTAIVCGNDVLAMGALFECQSMGLDLPRDVSVAGFDDLPLAAHLSPPLTTMAVPSEQMGRFAAEYLLARFAGAQVAERKELEVGLVVRETTAPPRGSGRGRP